MNLARQQELDRRRRIRSIVCGDWGHIARHTNAHGGPCLKGVAPGDTGCNFHRLDVPTKFPEDLQIGARIERRWGLPKADKFLEDEIVDPAEVLLSLITQSARRVAYYSSELGRLAAVAEQLTLPPKEEVILGALAGTGSPDAWHSVEDPHEEGALASVMAPDYAVIPAGERVRVGQKVRALTDLEARERTALAKLCKDALSLGIEARRVKIAQERGGNFAAVVQALVQRLGLSPDQLAAVPEALASAVAEVFEAQGATVEGEIV